MQGPTPESAPASLSCDAHALAAGRWLVGGSVRHAPPPPPSPPLSGCETTSSPASATPPSLPWVVCVVLPEQAARTSNGKAERRRLIIAAPVCSICATEKRGESALRWMPSCASAPGEIAPPPGVYGAWRPVSSSLRRLSACRSSSPAAEAMAAPRAPRRRTMAGRKGDRRARDRAPGRARDPGRAPAPVDRRAQSATAVPASTRRTARRISRRIPRTAGSWVTSARRPALRVSAIRWSPAW